MRTSQAVDSFDYPNEESAQLVMRIVMVDDHTLLRQSLAGAIAEEPGLAVVGEASSAEEAAEVIVRNSPDLVLIDIGLPGEDGIGLAGKIKRIMPSARLAFLTMHDDDASLRGALGLGASGFILKTAPVDEFIQALRTIAHGDSYLSPSIAKRVMELAVTKSASQTGALTDRELEVLRLIAQGHRPAEVAEGLFVSIKTVKNHLTRIYTKLGVETSTQAVSEGFRRGLVAISEGA